MKFGVTIQFVNGQEYVDNTGDFPSMADAEETFQKVFATGGVLTWESPDGTTHLFPSRNIVAVRLTPPPVRPDVVWERR